MDEQSSKNIIQLLPDIIYKIDPEGRFTYLNDSIATLGYQPEELLQKHFSVIIHPEDLSIIQRKSIFESSFHEEHKISIPKLFDERRTGSRITKKLHVRLIPKNWVPEKSEWDNIIHGELSSIGLYKIKSKQDGKIYTGTLGVIRDISQIKKFEYDFIRLKLYYQSLIENSMEIISIIAHDGTILSCSPAIERILGHKAVDLVGENILDYIHEDDRRPSLHYIEEELPSDVQPPAIEIRFRDIQGSWHVMEITGKRILDTSGDLTCFVFNSRDISTQHEARALLSFSEEKYKSVLDNIEEGYHEIDLNGKLTFFNRSVCRITGYQENELYGLSYRKLMSQSCAELVKSKYEDLCKAGSGSTRIEWELIKKNGEKRFLETSTLLLFDSHHNPIGSRGISRDITEKKHAEEELKAAQQQAEKSTRLKSSFIANISHEIRTPINSIIGYTDLLLDDQLTQKQMEYLQIIKNNGNLLMSLIDDILDISKIESGHIDLEFTSFSLKEFFQNIQKNAEVLILQNKKPIEVRNEVAEGISEFIISDPVSLMQVMNNLISNAVKFTENGSIDFGTTLTGENQLEFYVRDTGIGIPVEKQSLIFDDFQQVDSSVSRKYGGAGLGLSIAKRLVELLGGSIRVKSETSYPTGTTFFFNIKYIPSDNPITVEPKTVEKTASNFSNITVLLVEDNLSNLTLAQRLLEKSGWRVLTAHNGLEALKVYEERNDINLILMDIQMPVMDGIEAANKMKELRKTHPKIKRIPLIALTAHAMKGELEMILAAGFDDFITKPVNRQILQSTVEKYL